MSNSIHTPELICTCDFCQPPPPPTLKRQFFDSFFYLLPVYLVVFLVLPFVSFRLTLIFGFITLSIPTLTFILRYRSYHQKKISLKFLTRLRLSRLGLPAKSNTPRV